MTNTLGAWGLHRGQTPGGRPGLWQAEAGSVPRPQTCGLGHPWPPHPRVHVCEGVSAASSGLSGSSGTRAFASPRWLGCCCSLGGVSRTEDARPGGRGRGGRRGRLHTQDGAEGPAWGSSPRVSGRCAFPLLSQPRRSKRLRIDRPVFGPQKGPVGAGSTARAMESDVQTEARLGARWPGSGYGVGARRPHGPGQHCPFALPPRRAPSPRDGGKEPSAWAWWSSSPMLSHWTCLAPRRVLSLSLRPQTVSVRVPVPGTELGVSGVPDPPPRQHGGEGPRAAAPVRPGTSVRRGLSAGLPRRRPADGHLGTAAGLGLTLGRPPRPHRCTPRRLHPAVAGLSPGKPLIWAAPPLSPKASSAPD